MWPLTTFTIGFRGLMVIHRVETVYPNYFEIGVLNDPKHSLRINTIKNGMLAETKFLSRPAQGAPRTWAIHVDNPVGHGVSTYTQGPAGRIKRQEHSDEKDYRWITELDEIFPNIEEELITNQFSPVLKVYNGVFSTRVKSPKLAMIVNGGSRPFGCIAAVVACDIPMLPGRVRLVDEAQPAGTSLFDFEPDENTIYEFANTPGEAHEEPADAMRGHEHDGPVDDDEEDPCQFDHFKSYYQLFPPSDERPIICFRKETGRPAPDPATCGAVGTGGIKGPFGGG